MNIIFAAAHCCRTGASGRLTLALLGCLFALGCCAQPGASVSEARQYLELRGGYTGGRFAHSTDDYAPRLSLFGGGSSRTGQLVEHRFDGTLLGAEYVRETPGTKPRQTMTVRLGFDVLVAADRLTFADGRRATLPLGAAHPHLGLGLGRGQWALRGDAGLLLGRVGYYAADVSEGFLSSRTVVDTVRLVPTFAFRMGWANWLLLDGGYGATGLLGLANPAWHAGVGTGFGPRSPVALLFGTTGAESTDYNDTSSNHYFLQLEAAPSASRWRVSGFVSFGAGSYGRAAAQVAYRLPQRTAPGPAE